MGHELADVLDAVADVARDAMEAWRVRRVSAARHVQRLSAMVEMHAEFAAHLDALKEAYP